MVAHLKEEHYQNEGTGFYYSYQNYMEHLTQSLHYEKHNFSEVKKENMKLSFGIRQREHFILLRFPESRKNRTKKQSQIQRMTGKNMFVKHTPITLSVVIKVTMTNP